MWQICGLSIVQKIACLTTHLEVVGSSIPPERRTYGRFKIVRYYNSEIHLNASTASRPSHYNPISVHEEDGVRDDSKPRWAVYIPKFNKQLNKKWKTNCVLAHKSSLSSMAFFNRSMATLDCAINKAIKTAQELMNSKHRSVWRSS